MVGVPFIAGEAWGGGEKTTLWGEARNRDYFGHVFHALHLRVLPCELVHPEGKLQGGGALAFHVGEGTRRYTAAGETQLFELEGTASRHG